MSIDTQDEDMAEQHPAEPRSPDEQPEQLLHIVFGGELRSLKGRVDFRNLDDVDVVGVFPNYEQARQAWKAKAQQTVDNAHMRYFIVHLHRLLNPEND